MVRPALLAAALAFAFSATAAERQALQTRVAAPAGTRRVGRLPASTPMRLAVSLPLRNRDELDALLRDLADPTSPQYRHFLTVAEFTERFGPTEADYESVKQFAERQHLTVRRITPNRMVLDIEARADSVERAFGVHLGTYQHPTEQRTYFAPDVEPSLDLRGESTPPILSVAGLTDRERPRPLVAPPVLPSPEQPIPYAITRGSGPGTAYLGSDMRRAYAPGVSLDGTGQTVAIFELAPYDIRDIYLYFSRTGEPLNVPVINVLLDGVDGGMLDGGDDGEDTLDIQQAISLAPSLSAVLVYEAYVDQSSELDIWNQIATDDVARQISCSWGYGPDLADNQVFLEYEAQGQNLFQASGDFGAYSAKLPMAYPMDNANLVVVGGTHLEVDSDGGWASEEAWYASGGGVSQHHVPLPSWQKGLATADNHASTVWRNLPDVAGEADFDNYVCANGGCRGGWGGTSLAAPRWAGYMALVNQQAGGTPVGYLNPPLYALAGDAGYPELFHDITQGNDFNTDSPDLFSAEPGYDLVTGWGSPQGQRLIDALAPATTVPDFALTATPAFGQIAAGATATFTVTAQASGGFDGAIDLRPLILGTAPGYTATLSAASIAGSRSVDLTVTAGDTFAGAAFQVAVVGTSGNLTHTAQVTMGPEGFFLRAPQRVFLDQGSSRSIPIGINPVNGFARSVELELTGDLDAGLSATLSVPEAGPADAVPQLELRADANSSTGLFRLLVGGDAGDLSDAVSVRLGVSAALGTTGRGLPVDLSAAFNTVHIASDGNPFRLSGLRNDGYAYSANLLGSARILSGTQFLLGPPDALDTISCEAQTIPMPPGAFTDLWLLAAGVNGAQHGQNFIVEYADRTGVAVKQDFSDWDFPGDADGGELEAVAMDYRTVGNGTLDGFFVQNLYAYRFPVDPKRTLSGLTLPGNPNLLIHAVTLLGPSAVPDAGPIDAGTPSSLDAGTSGGGASGCGSGAGSASDFGLWGLAAIGLFMARRRSKASAST